jgi:hypothetical protein
MNLHRPPPASCAPVPLPYAWACHAALLEVLSAALERAVARGLVIPHGAQELHSRSRAAHSGFVRLACEHILGLLESHHARVG